MKATVLALAVVASLAVSANAQCLSFNFFPTKPDLGALNPANCTSNTTAGGCARPPVWLLTSQDSTGLTPARPADQLYKVALPEDNGVELHRIYWLPNSPLLQTGDVSNCVNKDLLAPAKTRRMRRLSATPTAPSWTASSGVIKDGSYNVAIKLLGKDGTVKKTYPAVGPINDLNKPYELNIPRGLPEGDYCLVLEATADLDPTKISTGGNQTLDAYAAAQSLSVPQQAKTVRKACFYKRGEQANALIKYGMCRTGKFEMNITKVAPLVSNLTLNGENIPGQYLFRPLLKIWGGKVRNLDGSDAPQEYDQNQQKLNYVAKYFLIPLNTTSDGMVNYQIADDLDEGYYQINVVVSLLTDFPKLVAFNGITRINQSDATGEEVVGKYEALAYQVTNGSEVGVQYSPTRLSEIKGSSTDNPIKTGSVVKFEWTFNGVGTATCTHDGVPVPNCKSPVTLKAGDVSSEDTKHTFTVTFTDVCGRVKSAKFSYTQKGVVTESKIDPVIPAGRPGQAAQEEDKKNAAATSLPGRFMALGLAFMALLASALL